MVHAGSETAGVIRSAVVGGLLLGAIGAALGALTGGKDIVLFEATWRDGRSFVGQCSSAAYQELAVSHRAANSPNPPAPFVSGLTTLASAVGLVAFVWLVVMCST